MPSFAGAGFISPDVYERFVLPFGRYDPGKASGA